MTAERAGADVPTEETGEAGETGQAGETGETGEAGETGQAGETGLASLLRGSPQPLSQRYDVALLDLDGVVYLGPSAVPGAPEALAKAAGTGMRLAFVTNNSSRTPAAIAAQLAGFGVPAAAGEVITSAQAAATLLADRLEPGAAVLVVGGTGLRVAVRERGLPPGQHRAGPARRGGAGLRARDQLRPAL